MVGLAIPVPRSADPIDTSANCSAMPGVNQRRYVSPASTVAASALMVPRYHGAIPNPKMNVNSPSTRGHQQALVVDQVRVLTILAPAGVRHQHHGADTKNLRQRHDHELHVARGGDAGDGGATQPRHEVQVDQVIHRLEDHPGGDGRRQADDMRTDWALREIVHEPFSWGTKQPGSAQHEGYAGIVTGDSWSVLPHRERPHDVVHEAAQPRRVLVVDVLGLVGDLVIVLRVAE